MLKVQIQREGQGFLVSQGSGQMVVSGSSIAPPLLWRKTQSREESSVQGQQVEYSSATAA